MVVNHVFPQNVSKVLSSQQIRIMYNLQMDLVRTAKRGPGNYMYHSYANRTVDPVEIHFGSLAVPVE